MNNAPISECGTYRYTLTRGEPGARLCFVMLNPSTADASEDDPTIRRCLGFMKSWGFTELLVLNLYAYRATDPKELFSVTDRHGPDNQTYLEALLPCADLVVCAWGSNALIPDQRYFLKTASDLKIPLYYLKMTNRGRPSHPLYLKADLKPQLWEVG